MKTTHFALISLLVFMVVCGCDGTAIKPSNTKSAQTDVEYSRKDLTSLIRVYSMIVQEHAKYSDPVFEVRVAKLSDWANKGYHSIRPKPDPIPNLLKWAMAEAVSGRQEALLERLDKGKLVYQTARYELSTSVEQLQARISNEVLKNYSPEEAKYAKNCLAEARKGILLLGKLEKKVDSVDGLPDYLKIGDQFEVHMAWVRLAQVSANRFANRHRNVHDRIVALRYRLEQVGLEEQAALRMARYLDGQSPRSEANGRHAAAIRSAISKMKRIGEPIWGIYLQHSPGEYKVEYEEGLATRVEAAIDEADRTIKAIVDTANETILKPDYDVANGV